MVGRYVPWIASVALSWATPASGQLSRAAQPVEAANAASEQARADFAEGLRYLRAEQWAQAEGAFRRSLELFPRASTRYNLALVLFKQRRARESLSCIAEVLDSPLVQDEERYHEYARTLRPLVLAELARVSVVLKPADATLQIDGERVQGAGSPRNVFLDPGPRRVQITAPGYEPHDAVLNAERGEEQRWEFELGLVTSKPPSARAASAISAPPVNDRREHTGARGPSTFARVAPWVTVGAGTLLLAGGVVAGVRAKRADDDFVEACPSLRNCDPDLEETQADAQRYARISGVLIGAGGAMVTGGIVWHLLTPASSSASPATSGRWFVSASGRF
jgi:hypothetical protein